MNKYTANNEMATKVMKAIGQIADCSAAIGGAIVSGGVGTGGAVATCARYAAGGAAADSTLTPLRVPGLNPLRPAQESRRL